MIGDEDGASADSEAEETLADSGIEDPAAGLDRSIDPPTSGREFHRSTPDGEFGRPDDVDRETYAVFWRLVVVTDVALLAVALGPMFIYFEGDWQRGFALLVLGVVAAGYGVRKYRAFREDGDAAEVGKADPVGDDAEASDVDATGE